MSQHHDPVHPDGDHLSPELIADLDEGLLDPASSEHAVRHLATCSVCRVVRDDLTQVKAILAGLPSVSMPTAVEQDLLDLLAEAGPVAGIAAPTVVPLSSRRSGPPSRWGGRGLGVAASVAGLLLLGALVVPSLMKDSGSTSGTAASDTAARSGVDRISFAASKTGTKYRARSIDQQVDRLVANNAKASPTPTVSDGEFSSPDVPTTPPETTVSSPPTGQPPGKALTAALHAALATDPAAAQACLEQYLGAQGVQPLAIDIGTFYDPDQKVTRPAAVIVIPDPESPAQAQVYVVDPECSGPDSLTLYWGKIDLPN